VGNSEPNAFAYSPGSQTVLEFLEISSCAFIFYALGNVMHPHGQILAYEECLIRAECYVNVKVCEKPLFPIIAETYDMTKKISRMDMKNFNYFANRYFCVVRSHLTWFTVLRHRIFLSGILRLGFQ
jgi:hypothetical protein